MINLYNTCKKADSDKALNIAQKIFPTAEIRFDTIFDSYQLWIPNCKADVRNAIMNAIYAVLNPNK